MNSKAFLAITSFIAIFLLAGCLVPRSKYDAKVREAEELRNSYVEVSSENEKLKKLLNEITKTVDSLKSELEKTKKELEAKIEENEKLKATVDELQNTYQSTKISRETLINELLKKEKTYSDKIKRLTVENTTLKGKVASLSEELNTLAAELKRVENELKRKESENTAIEKSLKEKTAEVEILKKEAEELKRKVHLLEGKVASIREESKEFIPYASVRGEAIAALSDTVSSSHITRDLPLLFAEIPLEVALDPAGTALSDDFATFLGKLADIIKASEGVKLDLIVTGKTYTGKMDVLLKLRDEEVKFLKALSFFLKKTPGVEKAIRKSGRQTLLDKLGKKEITTVVRIYLIRTQ